MTWTVNETTTNQMADDWNGLMVANRSQMSSVDKNRVTSVYLNEGGRSGRFNWQDGDFTDEVAVDTLQGVYVESNLVDVSLGVWVRKLDDFVSVGMFGAVTDVDCSDAVEAAVKFVANNSGVPVVGSNRVISKKILFEGGYGTNYIVSQPQKFMPNLGTTRYMGLVYEGANVGVTVHFDFDGDDYLCYNNNQFLFVRFKNIGFTCDSTLSKFIYSTANGGAQDYYFDDVSWSGTWQKLFVVRGTNNNSEWGWQKCSITTTIKDVMLDVTDSDQFLNYWFDQCKLWLFDGQCIRADKGGHFKFVSCDWSGLTPIMDLNQSLNGAPLFELLGNTHDRGVCDFRIIGGRFEHKNDLSKLMYCEWNQGTVFIDADCISSGYSVNTVETVIFQKGNVQGPAVKVTGSHQGRHIYKSASSGFNYVSTAHYEDVQVFGHTSINDFIEIDTPVNDGGSWVVDCDRVVNRDALLSSQDQSNFNATLGDKSKGNNGKPRLVKFRNAQGQGMPVSGGSFYIDMPKNAFIRRVKWYSDGTLTSSIVPTFQLLDGNSVVIDSKSQRLSDSWFDDNLIGYQLDASNNRLQLFDSDAVNQANQASQNYWCEIEYI